LAAKTTKAALKTFRTLWAWQRKYRAASGQLPVFQPFLQGAPVEVAVSIYRNSIRLPLRDWNQSVHRGDRQSGLKLENLLAVDWVLGFPFRLEGQYQFEAGSTLAQAELLKVLL
jgi:hypothetical protein